MDYFVTPPHVQAAARRAVEDADGRLAVLQQEHQRRLEQHTTRVAALEAQLRAAGGAASGANSSGMMKSTILACCVCWPVLNVFPANGFLCVVICRLSFMRLGCLVYFDSVHVFVTRESY
jgi:hypothetical protein